MRAAALGAASLPAAGAALADGYAPPPWQLYRDANPFVSASGLPFSPPAVAPGAWRVDAVFYASNSELGFQRARERLTYDGEFHELRLAATYGFGEHWIARAALGGEQFGSGFLDGFIEDFHRTFGFTNGDRGRLGTDGHVIDYRDDRGDAVRLDRHLTAATPLLLDLARRTPENGYEWLYGATLKLPTSHSSPLVDDRSTDLSLWVAAQSTDAATRFPWGARVGFMQRGQTELLRHEANDQVPFADFAVGYRPIPAWDLAVQYQWHRALYDSSVPFLGSAGNLTLSSAWHAHAGWSLRAGIVEDVPTRHTQDITFFLGLTL